MSENDSSDSARNDRSYEELLTSERRYRSLVEHGRDVIMILDPTGAPFYASRSLKNVLGYDPEEVSTIALEESVHPEDRAHVQRELELAMKYPGQPFEVTPARMRHRDGRWRWMEGTITNLMEDPEIGGIVDIFRDVTDRVKAQQEMEVANERLRIATEIARLGYWRHDLVADELYWSEEVYRLFGLNGTDFVPAPESFYQYIHPEDVGRFQSHLERALNGEVEHDFEYRILLSDGSVRWVRELGSLKQENGEPIWFEGTVQDITEKKNLELQLTERIRERECLYRISLLDEQHLSIEALLNEAVTIIPEGFQYPEITCALLSWQGETYRCWEGARELEPLIVETRPSSDQGEVLRMEVQYLERRPEMDEEPYLEEERQMLETIGSLLLTKIEKILQNEHLRDSLQEKETLLSEIHHRVKNNLAVVSGLLQIQRHQHDDEVITTQLDRAMSRIQSIATIHEQLYQSKNFSKVDFCENVHTLTDRIVNTFQGEATIEVDFDCDPVQLNINQAIPCTLIVNEVLTNTIKHAFTGRDHGLIQVEMKRIEGRLQLRIEDNGVGISKPSDSVEGGQSLGFQLMELLSDQLEAEHTLRNTGNGTRFEISFEVTDIRGSGSYQLR